METPGQALSLRTGGTHADLQGYGCETALAAFARARPPGIYKREMVVALHELYLERLDLRRR
jgi:hypothetical protein